MLVLSEHDRVLVFKNRHVCLHVATIHHKGGHTMICPYCQSQVADGVKFCGVCGKPIQVSQPQAQAPYGGTPPPQPAYGGPQGAYAPPNQYEEYANSQFGAAVPKAELHNPKGPIRVADLTV